MVQKREAILPHGTKFTLFCLGIFLIAAVDANIKDDYKASDCVTRTEMAEIIAQLEAKLQQKSLEENQVPIGFIYIQLPNQYSPDVIWPTVTWLEVTRDYAGLFFRAEGGESMPFGAVQSDNTRRISQMKYAVVTSPNVQNVSASGWSDYGKVGSFYTEGAVNNEGLQFYTTDDEVRPRNTAIRIWLRTM